MRRPDRLLLAAVLAITALGAVVRCRMAGSLSAGAGPLAIGLAAGTVCFFAFANGRAAVLEKLRLPALFCAVAALAATFFLGHRYRGGTYVAGNMNPTELVKPLLVLFAAGMLSRGADDRRSVSTRAVLLTGAGLAVAAAGLAALKDFGMLALVAVTAASVLFAASWKWGLGAFSALAIGGMVCFLHPVGHLARRLSVWRDPFSDPTGAGWQTLHALAAMSAGGLTGEGFGQGTVEAIPIASSDFVYAAFAEEAGLIGCCVLLALYLLFTVRGFCVAARAKTPFAAYLAVGLTAMVAAQVLVNVGGVVNAIPMTGVTLPLVSHGGSSLTVTLAACGLLLALSADSPEDDDAASPSRRGRRKT